MLVKQILLNALLQVRADVLKYGAPTHRSVGLCSLIRTRCTQPPNVVGAVVNQFVRLYMRWPEYSGNEFYPVPHPTGGHPAVAYHDAASVSGQWAGEYGAARIRLMNWAIAQLQERAA